MSNVVAKVVVPFTVIARAAAPALFAVAASTFAAGAGAASETPAATAPAGDSADAKTAEERRQRVETLARREGYRPIQREGARMYCREEEITGTRTRRQRTCFTEDQLELQIELEKAAASEVLERGLRGFTKRDP